MWLVAGQSVKLPVVPAGGTMAGYAAGGAFLSMIGGLWSVAYTDVFQLGLVAVGLLVALPFVLDSTGGLHSTLANYAVARPHGAALLPPMGARAGAWTVPGVWNWWDVAFMLMLGGISWNCFFQRVLSCRTPGEARKMSIYSGLLTIAFVVPATHPKGRSMTTLTMSTKTGTVQCEPRFEASARALLPLRYWT